MSLLFTSYMAVMGVAMLGTGWVSSRIGPKRTLLLGLVVIIVGAGLAGTQDTIAGIVGFRAVWGLGNALFIATALATIVGPPAARSRRRSSCTRRPSASASRPARSLGGALGADLLALAVLRRRRPDGSWRSSSTWLTLPDDAAPHAPTPLSAPAQGPAPPRLLTVAITALLYNFGFFTLLAFTPFPLDLSAHGTGLVFFGWGLLLAVTSVFVAPWAAAPLRHRARHRRRPGRLRRWCSRRWASWTDDKTVLVVGVVVAGGFIGVNNTLITETVMKVAPVERGVASAAYSFVRFAGGAVAPVLAGRLGERRCTCRSGSEPRRCSPGSPCSSPGVPICTASTTRSTPQGRSRRPRRSPSAADPPGTADAGAHPRRPGIRTGRVSRRGRPPASAAAPGPARPARRRGCRPGRPAATGTRTRCTTRGRRAPWSSPRSGP